MDDKVCNKINEIIDLLGCDNISFFLGAGSSYESNIPLIAKMTELVQKEISSIEGNEKKVFEFIRSELGTNSTIEGILTHIVDLRSLVGRTINKKINISNIEIDDKTLINLYEKIICAISRLVKYGYDSKLDERGSVENSKIIIGNYLKFVQSLVSNKKDKVTSYTFFTTNYDTLLEDSLAIYSQNYLDGFSRGAIGVWNQELFKSLSTPETFNVYKLHGSVDWIRSNEILYRARYGTTYFLNENNILIYPQSSKYVETQKDPFSYLFNQFRKYLSQDKDNVMIFNGFGFGDNHINNEIEESLKSRKSKTTFVVTIKENDGKLPECLTNWLNENSEIDKDRLYIITDKKIYNSNTNVDLDKTSEIWKFSKMPELLLDGGLRYESISE